MNEFASAQGAKLTMEVFCLDDKCCGQRLREMLHDFGWLTTNRCLQEVRAEADLVDVYYLQHGYTQTPLDFYSFFAKNIGGMSRYQAGQCCTGC